MKHPDDEYQDLEELIAILENVKRNGTGAMSFPKAIYLLANEMKDLKKQIERMNNENGF